MCMPCEECWEACRSHAIETSPHDRTYFWGSDMQADVTACLAVSAIWVDNQQKGNTKEEKGKGCWAACRNQELEERELALPSLHAH